MTKTKTTLAVFALSALAGAAWAAQSGAMGDMGASSGMSSALNFSSADKNGDDSISRTEYTDLGRQLFHSADSDNDGKVNQQEWLAGTDLCCPGMQMAAGSGSYGTAGTAGTAGGNVTQNDMMQKFSSADRNGDGSVTRTEAEQQWDQMFSNADTNKDGKLSQQEWQAHLSSHGGSAGTAGTSGGMGGSGSAGSR